MMINFGFLKEEENSKAHLENNMDWHGIRTIIYVGLST